MSRQIQFFAARFDLEEGVKSIESRQSLKYVLLGMPETPAFKVYDSLLQVASLGTNETGVCIRGDQFLVLPRSKDFRFDKSLQVKGGVRYFTDQSLNPISVVLRPGGLYKGSCLMAGSIGTISEEGESVRLFQEYGDALVQGFKRIGYAFVGPEALHLAKSGVRLITVHAGEPTEQDLLI